MADPVSEETARNRWAVIQALRLGGVALVLVGILIRYEVIPAPMAVGFVLMAIGLIDVFLVPMLLARRWRTPPS